MTAELIKRDASLSPLDPKTLKTAIEAYNRQSGKRQETLGIPAFRTDPVATGSN